MCNYLEEMKREEHQKSLHIAIVEVMWIFLCKFDERLVCMLIRKESNLRNYCLPSQCYEHLALKVS